MKNKKCLNCERLFEKKINCSRKNWQKQKYCSVECKETKFKKGHKTWNKGMKGYMAGEKNGRWKGGEVILKCQICQKEFSVGQYRKNAKFCSRKCSTEGSRLPENRERMSEIHKLRVKNGLHNLYRGATKESKLIRKSGKYKQWRKSVFEYDNYTCWICEKKGGKLHPHHLKESCNYPELRLKLFNGLTLCEFCHRTYTDFGSNKLLFREPFTININNLTN